MGFDHVENARLFHFEVMTNDAKERRTVQADLSLFPQHGLVIQEAPALCAQKLHELLTRGESEPHVLTAEDLSLHVHARQKAEADRAAVRKSRRAFEDDYGIPYI